MTSWRRDRALDEELRRHLDMATRDRVERGEDPRVAAANARREFGNILTIKEVTREAWGRQWLERLGQDLRYAARLLRQESRVHPGRGPVAAGRCAPDRLVECTR